MAAAIEGPNRAFAIELAESTHSIRAKIGQHPLYAKMERRELPLPAIYGYLGEMVPWFRGTMDRAIVRAQNTPYGPIKRTWLQWACEEFGHAEMLLDVIRLMGGDPTKWGHHTPIYESEALMSYMWKLAVRGSYLENAAGAFLATEGLLRITLPKFGGLLRDRYQAPPEAMKVFGEHEEADSDHFQHGLRIIASVDKLTAAEEKAVESALRTTLLFHEHWHDGILREYSQPD
jgi:pyrroloquinoline quinone (PQQ) biosynthesis protein C